MSGQIKVDSINADSNLALKIANTTVAFIDSSGLRPTSGNVNLDATATSKFYLPSANTVAIQTAGVTAVTVDSSQNVGIGTASPTKKLQVVTNTATDGILISGSTNPRLQVVDTTNSVTLEMISGDSIATIRTDTNHDLSFGTNGTERMRIDSSGNLVVNSSSQLGAAKISALFAGANNGICAQVSDATSGAGFAIFTNSAGGTCGYISRNTTTNAVLYNTSSDYRLKENVVPITNALSKIALLKPSKWVWKDTDGVEGEGFIAHELQEVIPAAVSGEKDAINEDGSIKSQGMDASYLVATLTAAIQELKAIVDAQAVRIAALES